MIDAAFVRTLALSLPEVTEAPHFERVAFKVRGKIFATMLERTMTVNLMFTPANQDIFTLFDKNVIYPVPNKWGLKGATTVNMQLVQPDMFKEALKTAYCDSAPEDLATMIKFD